MSTLILNPTNVWVTGWYSCLAGVQEVGSVPRGVFFMISGQQADGDVRWALPRAMATGSMLFEALAPLLDPPVKQCSDPLFITSRWHTRKIEGETIAQPGHTNDLELDPNRPDTLYNYVNYQG